MLQTWRLAYSVCRAYYERENRKIRDLNYLERARGRRGGWVVWQSRREGRDGWGGCMERIRKRGNAISPRTPWQMKRRWTETKAKKAGWAIAGEELGGKIEECKEREKEIRRRNTAWGGGEEKGFSRGWAGEWFVFPLLPLCMTQENLTVIIMEGWIIPIIEFASGTASVTVDLRRLYRQPLWDTSAILLIFLTINSHCWLEPAGLQTAGLACLNERGQAISEHSLTPGQQKWAEWSV